MLINLLPQEAVTTKITVSYVKIAAYLLVGLSIVIAIFGYLQDQSANQALNTSQILTSQLSSIDGQLEKLQAKNTSVSKGQLVRSQLGVAFDIKHLVNRLMLISPYGMSFSSISVNLQSVQLSGSVVSMVDLANYMDKVKKLPAINSIFLSSLASQAGSGGYSYTATIQLQ